MVRETYLGNMLDKLPELHKIKNTTFHYVVGIPDSAEINPKPTLSEYIKLIIKFSKTIFESSSKDSIFFFLQTDKYNKEPPMWIDKMYYISKIALEYGFYPFCKKIIINDFGETYSSRSQYTNLYGFSKININIYKNNSEFMKQEIIYNANKTWINGFAINAVDLCVNFIKNNSKPSKYYIVDPFIGEGSLLAICDIYGINSIGIDIEKDKIEIAKKLVITESDLNKMIINAKNKLKCMLNN